MSPNVSEERNAPIFRIGGDSTFLLNVGTHLPDYACRNSKNIMNNLSPWKSRILYTSVSLPLSGTEFDYTAYSPLNISDFLDLTRFSMVTFYHCSGRKWSLNCPEAASSSESLETFYQTTRRWVPEDSNRNTSRHGKLISRLVPLCYWYRHSRYLAIQVIICI
jgi:hypothetical protein